jgi:hypothetical protein
VNLRPVEQRVGHGETAPGGLELITTQAKHGMDALQPMVDHSIVCDGKGRNLLVNISFLAKKAGKSYATLGLMPYLRATNPLAAAIWRKVGAEDRPGIAAVTEDCLSFVMPQQHGTSVAACEDGN